MTRSSTSRPASRPGAKALYAVLVLGVALAGSAHGATVTIDDFSAATGEISAPPPSSTTTDDAGILGGERDLGIERVSENDPADLARVSVAGGVLAYSVDDPAVRGRVIVSYDGNDGDAEDLVTTGLGGVDLVDGTNNALRLVVDAVSGGVAEVIVTVFTDAANSSRAAATIAAAGDVLLGFDAHFSILDGSGADFTNVGAIEVVILGTGTDLDVASLDAVGPSLTVAKTDLDTGDTPLGTTAVAPGDTIRYRVTVETAGGSATDLDVADATPANTGSPTTVLTTPVAFPDQYTHVGNVTLTVPDGPGDLLANDFDPDDLPTTTTVTLDTVSSDTATAQGGTVSYPDASGAFTYEPPAGFRGVDSFTYTVLDDDGRSATAVATIFLEGLVWFVDDDSGATGDGSLADPFPDFTQLVGAGDVDGPGDIIFVFEHSGAGYDTGDAGGLVLENGQQLIGEAVGLVLGAQTVVPPGPTPVLHNSAGTPGHAITLASDNTLRGFDVGDTDAGAAAFLATADVGTLTISDVSISGSGRALHLAGGGTLAVTLEGIASTASTGSPAVFLDGMGGSLVVTPNGGVETSIAGAFAGIEVRNAIAGATFSFGDATIGTGAGHGVRVEANATAAVSFGDLDVTTAGGTGILGVTSGALLVGDADSTINAVGGPAINVSGLDLGAGWTFASASSSGAGRGIRVASIDDPITINGGSITKSTAEHAIDVDLGNAAFTYAGSVSQSGAGASVRVNGRSGGVHTFSGNVSGSMGGGVLLTANGGAQIDFTGGVNLQTGTNVAFQATGGGTVNVTSGSVVTQLAVNGAAHAIDMSGVSIGASDVTFDSITATSPTGSALDFDSVSNAGAFVATTVTVSGGAASGIDVDSSSAAFTFGSATIDGTTGSAVRVVNTSGAVAVNGGMVGGTTDAGNASSPAVHIVGGAGNVTVAAAVTNSVGRAVEVTGRGGGTVTFQSGTITDTTGTGIRVASNTAGTIVFDGDVDITNSTTSGVTVESNSGGATSFTDLDVDNSTSDQIGIFATSNSGHTLSTTTGTVDGGSNSAVDIDTTALGMTLSRLDSVGGAAPGIDLRTTTGSFTIVGNGATGGAGLFADNNGSGGAITGKTGNAVVLDAVTNVSLNYMTLSSNAGSGVLGTDVNGFVLTRTNLAGNGDAVDESAIRFGLPDGSKNGLVGTGSAGSNPTRFSRLDVSASSEHNVEIINTGGVLTDLVVEDSRFRDTASSVLGADGFQVEMRSSATGTISVAGSTFSNNATQGFQGASIDSASIDVSVTTSTFDGNNEGLVLSASGSGDLGFDIDGNAAFVNHDGVAIFVGTTSSATNASNVIGEITNNGNIQGPASAVNHTVMVFPSGDSKAVIRIAGNTIVNDGFFRGLNVTNTDNNGDFTDLDITITGNTVTNGASADHAIYVEGRRDANVCAKIESNTATAAGGTKNGIRFRERDASTVTLEQGGSASGDPATVLDDNNPASDSFSVTGSPAVVANGTCEQVP